MAKRKKKTGPALAYLRTSSATNIGADKDSEKRQRAAIEAFAKHAGFEIIDWYYDVAVSGADRIEERPGFADLLERLEGNGVKTIIVETANRFARDLVVQETGFHMLRQLGYDLIAADSPNSFLEDTPTADLIRQVLGAASARYDELNTSIELVEVFALILAAFHTRERLRLAFGYKF